MEASPCCHLGPDDRGKVARALEAAGSQWGRKPSRFAQVVELVLGGENFAVLRFVPGASYSAQTFAEYLADMSALLQRDSEFIFVLDMRNLPHPSESSYVWSQIEFLKTHAEAQRRLIAWPALVVDSAVMHALVRVVFTFAPPQKPFHMLTSAELSAARPAEPQLLLGAD